jgi:DnaJ-class molecular chaperone
MSSDDYYEILGLKRPSDQNEIRKAYHKLALKFHPDKNTSPEASEIFKKINEAYDILSTPEKKKIYDQFGKEGLNRNNIHFDESNIFNIFNNVFGQQFPFPFPFGPQGPSPFNMNQMVVNHLEISDEITLAEIYTGKKVSRVIERNTLCTQCNGCGSDDGKVHLCNICHGMKIVHQQHRMGPMIVTQQIQCPQCHGTGNDPSEHKCSKCLGNKIIKENHTIHYEIPVGQQENDVIVIRNEGHNTPENHIRGDIIIKVNIAQNVTFLRNETIKKRKITPFDLVTHVTITLAEALCGFDKTIKHINGKEIKLQVSDLIKDGDVYIVDRGGLPIKQTDKCGQLYIVFKIDTNITLSPEKKMVIWELLTDTPYFNQTHQTDPMLVKLTD